jgi:hypothetical protein
VVGTEDLERKNRGQLLCSSAVPSRRIILVTPAPLLVICQAAVVGPLLRTEFSGKKSEREREVAIEPAVQLICMVGAMTSRCFDLTAIKELV